MSDAECIDQVIWEIATEDERVADVLSRLAGNFAYDKILALIIGAKNSKLEETE